MQVPHNTYVLVADGRKLLFLRNDGDATALDLKVELAEEHPNPADRDQKTDADGRASGTQMGASAPSAAQTGGNSNGSRQGGGGQGGAFAPSRGTFESADFHQLEEARFAGEAAEMLKKRALQHRYDRLIVVAPPKTLGELRKHYHKEVEARLAGELAKDLTGHTIPDIEKALMAAE